MVTISVFVGGGAEAEEVKPQAGEEAARAHKDSR